MEPFVLDENTSQVVNGLLVAVGVMFAVKTLNDIIASAFRSEMGVEVALMDLTNEIRELKEAVNGLYKEQEEPQTEDQQQEEDQQEEEQQQEEQQQEATLDKHTLLRSKLTNNQELYVSYKRTTFLAKYEQKESTPHGYVLKYNNVEYLTPSQFSFAMKKTLNPAISSDNGWDTVFIITGYTENGKPLKKSLKELIA